MKREGWKKVSQHAVVGKNKTVPSKVLNVSGKLSAGRNSIVLVWMLKFDCVMTISSIYNPPHAKLT